MRAHRGRILLVAAVLALGGCARPVVAGASPAPASPSSATTPSAGPSATRTPFLIDGTPATDPKLDDVAQALGEQGRGAFSDVYSSLYVDRPPGAVTLYVTDDNRGRRLVAAAKKAHPRIDDGLVQIVHARFSQKVVDAQISRIMPATSIDPAIYSASANPDGSGIAVTVAKDRVAAEQARLTALITVPTGIPVTVTAGQPIVAK